MNYCIWFLTSFKNNKNLFNSHCYSDECTFYNTSLNYFYRTANRNYLDINNWVIRQENLIKINVYAILMKNKFKLFTIDNTFT